ncbi:DHH family phosphoesterase [Leucothrix pacifica]|uniref:Acetyltransferase n=1 Tax=Leucothrix pacifica TaxID=1247513 RepID=A0A317C8R8_9GAMM|nr:DHH family phosphoesterase [Leucothrix pacifica]PWQ92532.1 acetyltransferase [Leucothrix pacifica]
MKYIDVFNGDADGICALLQLRNAKPIDSELVTGVKRDIKLLSRVDASADDQVTVLDISLDSNREGLEQLLEKGAKVEYFDHHFAGDTLMEHDNLSTHINTAADCCTSTLVNLHLEGAFQHWAIVGAYGDNLKKVGEALSIASGLDEAQREQLENLGIYMNYNGYGATVDDLHFTPADLFLAMKDYASPFEFFEKGKATFDKLEQGYLQDMANAEKTAAMHETAASAAFMLPNEAWSRRVSGVYGNALANEFPDRAHAVITEREAGGYLVSVRAPLNNKTGADEICRQFPSGGGRKAAAGINELPEDQLQSFIDTLDAFYAA